MKLKIENYEIEIKARFTPLRKKMNARDTKAILNTLSIYASESAKAFENKGHNALASEAKKISDDIYNFLLSIGEYEI